MSLTPYRWPLVDQFVDRPDELGRLEEWWASSERMPINLYGRRRVGKSWLLRRFAHGKPAVVLVAERLTAGAQLARFADDLAPLNGGIVPDLPDVAALFRTLFRLSRESPLLVVIDEFPWLLGTTQGEAEKSLSSLQAVMEQERDESRLRLIVCGSAVGQMEAMQAEQSPLHGRLIPLEIRPLTFDRAKHFLSGDDQLEKFVRFAIAGGMPRYLAALSAGTLREAICREILKPDAPLWNEGRTIVGQELREPGVHFAILEQLSTGEKELGELASAARMTGGTVSRYLSALESLRVIERRLPIGSPAAARGGHWALSDPFLRFWFRFVFPFQADLETGLRPGDLYDTEIAPALPDHVAPVFEDACRRHARRKYGTSVSRVSRWWGNSLNNLRRTGQRSSEEIDIVGMAKRRVVLTGEAKWTSAPLGPDIVHDLEQYKVPALRQAGFKVTEPIRTVLYSKSGFTQTLLDRAAADQNLDLVAGIDALAS